LPYFVTEVSVGFNVTHVDVYNMPCNNNNVWISPKCYITFYLNSNSNSKFIRKCGQKSHSNTIRQRQYKLQSQTTKFKKILAILLYSSMW